MNWRRRAGALLLALVTVLSLTLPAAAASGSPSLSITPSSLDFKVGDAAKMITVKLEGLAKDPDTLAVTFTSSNESVAKPGQPTVTAAGRNYVTVGIAPVGEGTATITASTTHEGQSYTATCSVAVTAPPQEEHRELRLTTKDTTVEAGTEITINAQLESSVVGESIQSVTWSPSSVVTATVSDNGRSAKFRSDGQGTVRVTATATTNQGNRVEGTIDITVVEKTEPKPEEIPTKGLAFNQTNPQYINRNTNLLLSVTPTPSNATDPVEWEIISGEDVVELVPDEENDRRCTVEGKNVGAAVIVAKAGDAKTSSFTVEVSGITLDPLTLDLFEGGEPGTLVASRYGAARTMQLIWESQSEPIANVVSGKVYPNGIGTAKIIVSAGANYRAECTVTVKENVAGIIEAGSVQNGASFSFSERGLLSDLRSRCKEMTEQSLKLVRGLAVSPQPGSPVL